MFPIYLTQHFGKVCQNTRDYHFGRHLLCVLIISVCFVMSLSNFWDVVCGPATCLTNLQLCICWLTRLSLLKATVHVCGPEVTGGFWIDHVIGLGSYVSQDPRHSRLSKPLQLGLRSDDSMSSSPPHASARILPLLDSLRISRIKGGLAIKCWVTSQTNIKDQRTCQKYSSVLTVRYETCGLSLPLMPMHLRTTKCQSLSCAKMEMFSLQSLGISGVIEVFWT